MGLILDVNRDYYSGNFNQTEHEFEIDFATIQAGQAKYPAPQAQFSQLECQRLLSDLDAMFRQRANEDIAAMVAEGFPAILAGARWAKKKAVGAYTGSRGIGSQLAAVKLRGAHIGGITYPITNSSSSASSLGLYGGTGGAVYSWLPSAWVAGTAKTWFPSQTMHEKSAIVLLGFEVPDSISKVDAYSFTLNGVATPVLPLDFEVQRRQSENDPLVAKLVEPVIFGPSQLVQGDLYPHKAGSCQPIPIAVVITMASNLKT